MHTRVPIWAGKTEGRRVSGSPVGWRMALQLLGDLQNDKASSPTADEKTKPREEQGCVEGRGWLPHPHSSPRT